MSKIVRSVGQGGVNLYNDVITIKKLLNKLRLPGVTGELKYDGDAGKETITRIEIFQKNIVKMAKPDGRIDPGGKTMAKLVAGTATKTNLTDEINVPVNINTGLICPTADNLTALLGKPRDVYSQTCQSVTNKTLSALIKTANIGPFSVTGLGPAVESLKLIAAQVHSLQPDVYRKLGTAGMLCCRFQRGSTKISSHSWGTAIDLTIDGKLDVRGNKKVHYGLSLVAPIFNRHGWYWGAAFRTEDAMHFEVGKAKLEEWKSSGLL